MHRPSTPCYWYTGSHQPRQQHCPAYGKRCNKCKVMGHFSCACQSRASHQRSNQRYNFVEIEPSKETFAMNGHKTAWSDKRPERKFFAHLRLVHGGKRKVLRAQIDSASTYNTMPQSLLRKLFPGAQTWKTKITISTYGDQPLRPRGSGNSLLRKKRETPHLTVPSG